MKLISLLPLPAWGRLLSAFVLGLLGQFANAQTFQYPTITFAPSPRTYTAAPGYIGPYSNFWDGEKVYAQTPRDENFNCPDTGSSLYRGFAALESNLNIPVTPGTNYVIIAKINIIDNFTFGAGIYLNTPPSLSFRVNGQTLNFSSVIDTPFIASAIWNSGGSTVVNSLGIWNDTGAGCGNDFAIWGNFGPTRTPTISVAKGVSANPIAAGSGATYFAYIDISGGSTTTPISLYDPLPSGFFLSGVPSIAGGTTSAGASISCSTGFGSTAANCSIPAGAGAGRIVVSIPVQVAAETPTYSPTNTVYVTGGTGNCTGAACTGSVAVNVNAQVRAPTIALAVSLPSGRAVSSDQFTAQIAVGASVIASATTAGADTVAQTAVTTVTSGAAYTLTQVTASGDLARYTSTMACGNSNPAGTNVSGITTPGQAITPVSGDVISCTIVNTPRVATIQVTKAIAGIGRVNSIDQFTVQIKDGATVTASATTSGTGSTVAGGSTGVTVVTPERAYNISEVAASGDLTRYSSALSCSNSTPGGTNVNGITTLGQAIVPAAGDAISCTIVNTPRVATIQVTKAIAGIGRVNSSDQFTVQIKDGATVMASATTSGTGSTVAGGSTGATVVTPGRAYNISEVAASGDLTRYSSALSCSNSTPGGTNVNGITTLGQAIVPAADDAISCTITNTSTVATLQVSKVIAGTGRIFNSDQFTVQIKDGSTVVASATTTGVRLDATGGATGPIVVTPGRSYSVNEIAASGDLNQYIRALSCSNSNPAGTNVSGITTLGQSIVPAFGDSISCTITNTGILPSITVNKVIAGTGRVNSSDQFTIQIREGSAPTYSTTTGGSGNTVTNGTVTASNLTVGWFYSITEVAAPGNLALYNISLSCSNSNPAGTNVSGITALDQIIWPYFGDVFSCTLTNTPKATSIQVSKQFAGSGRFNNTDQFTVQIKDGAVVTASATTSGTGAVVTGGATGPINVTAGRSYSIAEVAASGDLTQYNGVVSCSNSTPGGSSVSGITSLGQTFVPVFGDAISCIITNTSKVASIQVSKQLGGAGRVNNTDQFTVQIKDGAVVTASATTSGTGATVAGGGTGPTTVAAGRTYSITEVMASGNLAQYTSAISCSNSTAGGTNVSGISALGQTIVPASGDVISCIITNTPRAPTITFSKVLGTARALATDQFTVALRVGGVSGSVVSSTASSTTAGTGSTVNAGSGTTGVFTAAAGTAYTLSELAAGTTNLGRYSGSLSCVDGAGIQAALPNAIVFSPATGATISPAAGAQIVCTLSNGALPATLQITQLIQVFAPSEFSPPATFTYQGNNGWATQSLNSIIQGNLVVGQVQTLSSLGLDTTLNVLMPQPKWSIGVVQCSDSNAAVSGNASSVLVETVANPFTIPAANVRAAAVLNCLVIMTRREK